MNCDKIRNLLDPLVDEELPERERDVVRCHLDGCSACQHEFRQIDELRRMLKRTGRHAVPHSLQQNVRERIVHAADPPIRRLWQTHWMRPVVTHAAAALVGIVLFYGVLQLSGTTTTPMREIVAAHVRSLMDNRMTQVSSSDTHTVAPWFAGKIDYAPAVNDFSAEGFPLLGGRVEYLQEKRVAALVYLRRKHFINLFVLPSESGGAATFIQRSYNGFSIVGWSDKGFTYWAISDLNLNELTAFSKLTTGM